MYIVTAAAQLEKCAPDHVAYTTPPTQVLSDIEQ